MIHVCIQATVLRIASFRVRDDLHPKQFLCYLHNLHIPHALHHLLQAQSPRRTHTNIPSFDLRLVQQHPATHRMCLLRPTGHEGVRAATLESSATRHSRSLVATRNTTPSTSHESLKRSRFVSTNPSRYVFRFACSLPPLTPPPLSKSPSLPLPHLSPSQSVSPTS